MRLALVKLLIMLYVFSHGTLIAHAVESVSIQLPWHHQFQFAGYYMAKELGLYQKAGLEVELRDVSYGSDAVAEVVSGRATFGVSGSGLVVERSNGKPVVVLAAIFQQSPTIFIALERSGIKQPADFAHKRVMLSPGFASLSLIALLHQEKVLESIVRIDTSFDYTSLFNGQTDVFNAYLTNEPALLKAQGHNYTIINPKDYGINFYGDTLFTSEQILKNKPDVVEKFRQASIEGWEYALNNPDEAIRILEEKYRVNKTTEQLQFEAAEVTRMIQHQTLPIGTSGLSRWGQITHHLIAIGAVPAAFRLDNDFLYIPPEKINWKRFIPWFAGAAVIFLVLVSFMIVLARANRKLSVARKQGAASENKFKALAETSPLAIYAFVGPEKKAEYVNPAFTEILGYTIEDVPTLNDCWPLVYPDESYRRAITEEWQKRVERAIETRTEIEPVEAVVKCKDGSEKTISWGFNAVSTQTWVKGLDLTASKQAEKQRLEFEHQLHQKHKMEAIGYMAGGIAHNFNNNLAIILGNLELAQMKLGPSSDINPYLNSAKVAITRSKNLVKKIITYSRKRVVQKKPVRLSALIDETIGLLESTLPSTVILEKFFSDNCESQFINADESQIQEALINLCNNAVHAMAEHGELKILLESVELNQKDIPSQYDSIPGSYARIRVQDSGCGIPDDIIDKIFDPFYSTKDESEGAGMGLATVHGIVAEHGGIIKVLSDLNSGTKFDLYFPIIESPNLIETVTEKRKLTSGTEQILFVDDDEMLATVGARLLTELGYQVTTITDSVDALTIFTADSERFDLVITDQTMPKLAGLELIGELKKIRADIPTIICTGYSSKVDEETDLGSGANAFLMKPLELEVLSQTIRSVLDKMN